MSNNPEEINLDEGPAAPAAPVEVKPDPRVEDLVSAEEIAKAKAAGFAAVVVLGDTPSVQFVPDSNGIQLAHGRDLEEVLEVSKVTITEITQGKWVGNADGVIFEFTLDELLAHPTPPDCVKAKYLAAKG